MRLSNEMFARAVTWLIDNRKVDDQQDLSAKTGITQTTISRILNDRVKKPSEETVKKLLDAFPGVFNPEYFRGENIYMLKEVMRDNKEQPLAGRDETIAKLEKLVEEKDDHIATLKARISDLQRIIFLLRSDTPSIGIASDEMSK